MALVACSSAASDEGPERPVRDAAPTPSQVPSGAPSQAPGPIASPSPSPPSPSGRPQRAVLSIPAIDVAGLVVVPYRGRTDDAPGTEIQDRGLAAAPYGPEGGTGPGGVGNYQVTAHRLSSTRAFLRLPELSAGDRVVVDTRRWRHVYEVRRTRETSFRSQRSLEHQRAAVPGRPGAEPTKAYLTLSTCATPEDRAAGNYWSDEFGNPEHRIDKIAVLVRSVRR